MTFTRDDGVGGASNLVERQNKTLATISAIYVDKSQKDWDEFPVFVTLSYNSALHESTNQTHFILVYGKEAVIPMDLWPAIGPRQTKLVESKDLIKVMTDQREVVKDRLTIIQQRQKA